MIRATTLSAAALLALAALGVPGPASAAAPTCQGVPATHVGDPGSGSTRVTGTEGPDVIVTNGAYSVDARGGDDLICSTAIGPLINAGAGDDVVWATETRKLGPIVTLGPGSDRFTGSGAYDSVIAGEIVEGVHRDTERDVIDGGTGGPWDDVISTGQAGLPNPDEVRTGGGQVLFEGTATPQTVLVGTLGSMLATSPAPGTTVRLDVAAGTYTEDGAAVPFSGFGRFSVGSRVEAVDGPRSLTFVGTDREETLEIRTGRPGAHDISMGGGTDVLDVLTTTGLPEGGRYDGGAGRTDQLRLVLPQEKDVDVDLGRGRWSTGVRAREVEGAMRAFERADVVAKDVELVGTGGSDVLTAWGCRTGVDGRGGADFLRPYVGLVLDRPRCRRFTTVFHGGGGGDTLWGSRRDDRLVGGPGKDSVRGRAGRDVCQGETLRGCEKRA